MIASGSGHPKTKMEEQGYPELEVHAGIADNLIDNQSLGVPVDNNHVSLHSPALSLRAEGVILAMPRNASFILSDSTSAISPDEISQRREDLKLFSSEQSMLSFTGRSMTAVSNTDAAASMAPVTTNNNTLISYEPTPFSSTLSSLSPLCRICQCPSEAENILITPCRCDGSLKHIHATCLLVSGPLLSVVPLVLPLPPSFRLSSIVIILIR